MAHEWQTKISRVLDGKVIIHGYSHEQLIGDRSYADGVFLTLRGKLPTKEESRLTDAMLNQAASRTAARGWGNVELVQSDASEYGFLRSVNGIISTHALTLFPEYEAVIRSGAQALAPGGRWVISDLKMPSNWLAHTVPLLLLLVRPFGTTMEALQRRPWEVMEKCLQNVTMTEFYLGVAYIAVGEA